MDAVRPIYLTCAKLVSPLLRREVEALGLPILSEDPAGVRTEGGWDAVWRLNLHLRTAMRVLWVLREAQVDSMDAVYAEALDTPWEQWIDPDGYFTVQAAVDTALVDHTGFPALRVKDAIADRFRQKTGRRPDSGPDASRGAGVFLYWKGRDLSLCLDTSGEPLSHRGYRLRPGEAPLRESLAASLLLASGWEGRSCLLSPMGGSGTLAIEAAHIALGRAPGLLRRSFAFQHLRGHDPRAWARLTEAARSSARRSLAAPIILSDLSAAAVEHARGNARAAGVEDCLRFETCDFRECTVPAGAGVIFINPPYGQRLGSRPEDRRTRGRLSDPRPGEEHAYGHRPEVGRSLHPLRGREDRWKVEGRPGGHYTGPRFERSDPAERAALDELYSEIGRWLKARCRGKHAYVFSASPRLVRRLRLNPGREWEFYNTQIPCRLTEFALHEQPPAPSRPPEPGPAEGTSA